jgi:hypothetical protein
VMLGAAAASVLLISAAVKNRQRLRFVLAATLAYAAALLGAISVAYMTKRQPVLFPRYGLTLFSIALPLFIWLLCHAWQSSQRLWIPNFIAVLAILICFWDAKRQLAIIPKVVADFRAHRQIAETLAIAVGQSPRGRNRCFSDDPAVRVLSQLSADHFVRSQSAPGWAGESADHFEAYLRQNQISYLVVTNVENSLAAKFFPEIGRKKSTDPSTLEFLAFAPSPFAPDIWLFRLRPKANAVE